LNVILVTLKIVFVLLKFVLVTLNNAQELRGLIRIFSKSITLANGSNSSDRNAAARHYNSTLLLSGAEELEPLYNFHNKPIPQFPLTVDSIKTMDGMCGYENDV
jgi:hypothetical protein